MLQNHKVPAQGNPRIVHRSMEGSVSQSFGLFTGLKDRRKCSYTVFLLMEVRALVRSSMQPDCLEMQG